MKVRFRIIEGFLKGRFSIMLLAFAVLFLVVPVLPVSPLVADKTSDVLSILVVISCLRGISVSRGYYTFMLVLLVVTVLLGSTAMLNRFDAGWFQSLVLSLRLGYLMLIFISIMRYVLDSSPVTIDKVCGALSAYFLMGFSWSVGFMIFHHVNPASFNVEADAGDAWATYFSFTTLTTLGYGDISPQTVAARAYAIMEAACGQIFLAVIVARLVALQIAPGATDKPD
jgi:voltage-gated potassium channel Kch